MRPRPLALAGVATLALAPAVAVAAWSPPERVASTDRAGYLGPAPAVAGDRAIAAWIRALPGADDGRVQVAERPAPGAPWTGRVSLSGGGASRLASAAGERGAAAVAWARGDLVEGAQRARARAPWRPAPVAGAGGPVERLALAVDRRGGATVVWSERHDDGSVVRVASRRAGRSWAVAAARLEVPGADPPALAVGRGSGVLVAWVEDDRVHAARTVDGGFEAPRALSEEGARGAAADLSPAGTAMVAWSLRLPAGTSVVMAVDRPIGGEWGRADDLGIGSSPVVAVDDRGDAVVAWSQGEEGGVQSVESVTRRGRGAWRATTVVDPRPCACALTAARAAIDDGGLASVAWRRDRGSALGPGGVAAREPSGGGWDVAARPFGAARGVPGVGVAAGRALALWGRTGGVVATSHDRGAR